MRPTVVALALAALVAAPAAQEPAADELGRRIQARYELVRDFTADFTQTTRSALLPQTSVERGSVKLRKPGLMRWEYVEPEKKVAGSDGTDFYVYVVADRVVTYTSLPKPGEETTALLFLSGRGNLATDYSAHMPADQPAGEWHLALTPRRAQDEYLVRHPGRRPPDAASAGPRNRRTRRRPFNDPFHELPGERRAQARRLPVHQTPRRGGHPSLARTRSTAI